MWGEGNVALFGTSLGFCVLCTVAVFPVVLIVLCCPDKSIWPEIREERLDLVQSFKKYPVHQWSVSVCSGCNRWWWWLFTQWQPRNQREQTSQRWDQRPDPSDSVLTASSYLGNISRCCKLEARYSTDEPVECSSDSNCGPVFGVSLQTKKFSITEREFYVLSSVCPEACYPAVSKELCQSKHQPSDV